MALPGTTAMAPGCRRKLLRSEASGPTAVNDMPGRETCARRVGRSPPVAQRLDQ